MGFVDGMTKGKIHQMVEEATGLLVLMATEDGKHGFASYAAGPSEIPVFQHLMSRWAGAVQDGLITQFETMILARDMLKKASAQLTADYESLKTLVANEPLNLPENNERAQELLASIGAAAMKLSVLTNPAMPEEFANETSDDEPTDDPDAPASDSDGADGDNGSSVPVGGTDNG